MAETATARKRKPAAKRSETDASERGTLYTTLTRVGNGNYNTDTVEFRDAVTTGRVWVEGEKASRGARGDEAIKVAHRRADGSVAPGTFKAVPCSTWDAEANVLISAVENKPVNTFSKPGKNGNSKG